MKKERSFSRGLHGTVLNSVFRAEFFQAFFRSCKFLKSERTKHFFGEIRKREFREGRRRKMKWFWRLVRIVFVATSVSCGDEEQPVS